MANIHKETILTQEYVKQMFEYKDGHLYRKELNPADRKSKIGDIVGWVSNTHSGERAMMRIGKYTYYISRIVFFYHHNWWPEMVDHEDRNPLNNRIENLRAANGFQNASNVSKQQNTSSSFMGVVWHKGKTTRLLKTTGKLKTWFNPKWRAQISVNNKRIALGSFKHEVDAAKAYNKAAILYHGEFANLNDV